MMQILLLKKFVSEVKELMFITPLFYSVGNAAEEILWAHARAKALRRKVVIIKPYRITQILSFSICNKYLFEVGDAQNYSKLQQKIIKISCFVVNINFFIKRLITLITRRGFGINLKESWHFPTIGKEIYWPLFTGNVKEDPIFTTLHSARLDFINMIARKRSETALSEIGLRFGQKYVCLHVRDAGFHQDKDRRPYRNADVNSYKLLIDELILSGFVVIRLGDKNMKPLTVDNVNYKDYPFSSIKSEYLDLYLIKNCEFYIGMQSGLSDVAALFNKPILTLNMYDWFYQYPLKKTDRGLLKKLRVNKNNITYDTGAIFSLPFYYTNNRNIYNSTEVEFIDNTPEELLYAVREFIADYKSGFTRIPDNDLMDLSEKYRIASERIINSRDLDCEFQNLPPQHRSRLTYRNLASIGYLYKNIS